MTDVSIIIVNYNTLKMTSECIDSVIEKTQGISYEIILVDNASTDGSKEFFSEDSRVKYIYNDENLGFGRANNRGIEIAEGRNIMFLNPDTILMNNAVKILSDYLDKNSKVGACGANLFNLYGKPDFSYSLYFPSVITELNTLSKGFIDFCIYGNTLNYNNSGRPKRVKHISGADLMVKSVVLSQIGSFDPAFFLYYEETELCHRIHDKNYRLYSVPAAQIQHIHGVSTRADENLEHHEYMMEKSRRIYYRLAKSEMQLKISDFVRNIAIITKLCSPLKSTRENWRMKRSVYSSIRKSERNA